MRSLLVISAILGVAFASPIEIVTQELVNEELGEEFVLEQSPSPYLDGVEFGPEYIQEWNLIHDGDGNLHLSNLHEAEPELENRFNANTDVIFRVFTRRNPTAGQVITVGNAASISNSQFNSGHPTRIIIHGWNNNGGSAVNIRHRDAYLQRGEFNVIVVDWGAGAQTANYASARNRVPAVAARVAQFVDFMNQSGGMGFGSTIVVGHSLGGHTAGITGKRVTRGRLAAVVALDPALPLFITSPPADRVAPTDANYVEVMHTNAGLLGFDLPIGLADYYPNFGSTQPGCGADLVGNCAHGRAWEFMSESINSNVHFTSRLCRGYSDITSQNCVSSGTQRRMGGEPLTTAARGVYWCSTNASSPFARGAAGA